MSATLGEALGDRIAALLSGGPAGCGAQERGEVPAPGQATRGTAVISSEGRSFPVALRYLGPPGDPFRLFGTQRGLVMWGFPWHLWHPAHAGGELCEVHG